MKITRNLIAIIVPALISGLSLHAEEPAKLLTQTGQISFFSSTPAEDIKSINNNVVGTLDPRSGEVAYSVPMQGFEFEKALMQKHFNNKDFLNTAQFPRATFKGRIVDLASVDFSRDGVYSATVAGVLTVKGLEREVSESGTLTVKNGTVLAESKFELTLADFGIEFVKGKPSKNIAKVVEVTVRAAYAPED